MKTDMNNSLTGRVALVTGASREIGAAMAEALAKRGCSLLVAHYREPGLADATVSRIRAAGGTALSHEADSSQVAENQALVDRAVREFGRLDIFVANAGLTMWAPFLDYPGHLANCSLKVGDRALSPRSGTMSRRSGCLAAKP